MTHVIALQKELAKKKGTTIVKILSKIYKVYSFIVKNAYRLEPRAKKDPSIKKEKPAKKSTKK